jgi:hypothetical protein
VNDLSLFDEDLPANELELAFREFHAAHPEVYAHLVRLARRAVRRGHRHLGIGMLWETMRYRTLLGAQVPEEDEFRLNDHHRAYYARLMMKQETDLDGVFELRRVRGES